MNPLTQGSPEVILSPPGWTRRLPTAVLLTLAFAWCWLMLCRFPLSAWNDIRLVPAFMLAEGEAIYPRAGEGVITTWMYGPLPLLLLWPTTLMSTVSSALWVAGALNIGLAVLSAGIAARWWPSAAGTPERWLVFAATILLWPESSFRYIQPDNAAVLFGMISLVLLARHAGGPPPAVVSWASAVAGIGALACKQIALAPAVAGILWLLLGAGPKAAAVQTVRSLAVGGAAMVGALVLSDPAGLWHVLVRVPGGLPWVGDVWARTRELAGGLGFTLGLPLILVLAGGRGWLSRGTPQQLALLAWLVCIPPGLLAAFKSGGSINSFHGYQLILPALLLDLASRPRARRGLPWGVFLVFALLAWPARHGPWWPRTGLAEEAVALARQHERTVWLPWHPLAAWYAYGEFHHAEDGMYSRFISQIPLTYPHVRRHLPQDFQTIALPAHFADWGIAKSLVPPGAVPRRSGSWELWPRSDPQRKTP